ncbi:tubulin-tyrosine ligase family-domain-containing protein [Zychaea mexicana]|uniref:tubulin-tyrosine ligase family-domain-containing protein n=1 Tax=Zychaea mexicana TaxID=64656 RepID=UPI0022FE2F3B|nr:tubulin-tyrosine ligase family-domain-containing protein [Zychaea mexicana]KAI9497822.1 tubulin-tyrosine ligase family-domain-containing protein [Zychaea mexicana]
MSSAFDAFVTVHQYQLAAIPKDLWLPLFMKLGEDYLDAGNHVELHYGDPLEGYSLHVKADQTLKKHSEIFLVDHAWTTQPDNAHKELAENTNLLSRLENLMDIESEEFQEEEDSDEEELEHDEDAIKTVAEQANVSRETAREALVTEKYEVVNAIMRLTLDEDFKKESERLQDQVLGQLIASGKAQEKEDKVNKEKEERRKTRHAQWLKERVDRVCDKMWSYLQTYSYSVLKQDGQPETQTAWYINDEVGSALSHSSDPNILCLPFIFSRGASGMIPYTVMFPIKDIAAGEVMTCDLVPKNLERSLDKAAYLLAYEHRVLPGQEVATPDEIKSLAKDFRDKLAKQTYQPSVALPAKKSSEKKLGEGDPILVYTTTEFVRRNLSAPHFKLTDALEKANIIWSSQDFAEWESLKPGQMVNQFRYENCLTYKQQFADLIQKTYGSPAWIVPTYNLNTQLAEFVGHYLSDDGDENDDQKHHENLWISKPWNFARGLEISVSRDLPKLIRQHDSPTPKIAQRYLVKPCLYNSKKFDLRYIVLVTSDGTVNVYKMFWIRLANKKYNTDDLDDYEAQFTVMNYSNYQMTQLDYKSFIHNIEKQHSIDWSKVQNDINGAIKDVFLAAASEQQPLGLIDNSASPSYESFGMYGVDVLLNNEYRPIIVEINFSPDCTRACKYDPQFVNNVFGAALGDKKGLEAFNVL